MSAAAASCYDELRDLLASSLPFGGAGQRIDLHVHSTASDGSLSAAELVDQARELGIGCIALTNHDTVRGLDEAVELGRRRGVRVIGGIEVSAWDARRGRKVHILGYGLSSHAPALSSLCTPLLERRNANSHWQLQRLIEAGYSVDAAFALRLAGASTSLYKQHIMAALTSSPRSSPEYGQLYRSLFKGEGICARDIEYVDMCDAVRAVCADGGVPVMAHPGQLDSYDAVPELVELGLAGIELYHPDHTEADHERCRELASRYGLLCTAGSDYHGAFGSIPSLGYKIPQ